MIVGKKLSMYDTIKQRALQKGNASCTLYMNLNYVIVNLVVTTNKAMGIELWVWLEREKKRHFQSQYTWKRTTIT